MWRIGKSLLLEMLSGAALGTVLFTFVIFLQRVSRLFEQLVRGSASPETVGQLFILLLPYVLSFTIPVGVLVGILIALSRMSADNEVIALRACGISSRKLAIPVMSFAVCAMFVTAAMTLWLTPLSIRQTFKLLNQVAAAQLTAEIQPRVFGEQFPNTILYVGDVLPYTGDLRGRPVVRWKDVFVADLTPLDQRKGTTKDLADDPGITVASQAIAYPDLENNRLQLLFENVRTHEVGKDWQQYYSTSSPRGEHALEAAKRGELRPRLEYTTMDTRPLYRESKHSLDARIELHQRLALPPACLLLALIALPLGISSRKGGRSAAFVLTILIAFLYYLGLITFIGLARQGTLPVEIALWLPNAVLLAVGVFSFLRLETPGDRDILGGLRGFVDTTSAQIRGSLPSGENGWWRGRTLPLGPQIIDNYVLSSFLFYFGVWLISFVLMTEVFTFFELLSDILKNQIPMTLVAKYLFFLTPKLIYETTPVSILVAVLVTFGIMTKNNEVTAMKACGISLYRLSVPVLFVGLLMSGGLFAFDHYIVPDANRIQDAIRNQIKGRPVQTYFRPNFNWIVGANNRIYFYKYFDATEGIMGDVNVYELDRDPYRLRRHISAERARWEPALSAWTFQNGWSREITKANQSQLNDFSGRTSTFRELQEPPSYFLKEVKQDKQMNFRELAAYIKELQQSGFDTVRLQVQYHKKFAVPLFALIMAMISLPFSFMSAQRGASAGIGVSLGIAISYWAVSQLFEQVGNINQLPAAIAAWSPDAVFSLAGLYFLARMRT